MVKAKPRNVLGTICSWIHAKTWWMHGTVSEEEQLMHELCFVISTSIIENHPQMNELLKRVYPKHLEYTYSIYAGGETTQYPLGLRDCNENRIQDIIQLLKEMSKLYIPCKDDTIVEPVFCGGDR